MKAALGMIWYQKARDLRAAARAMRKKARPALKKPVKKPVTPAELAKLSKPTTKSDMNDLLEAANKQAAAVKNLLKVAEDSLNKTQRIVNRADRSKPEVSRALVRYQQQKKELNDVRNEATEQSRALVVFAGQAQAADRKGDQTEVKDLVKKMDTVKKELKETVEDIEEEIKDVNEEALVIKQESAKPAGKKPAGKKPAATKPAAKKPAATKPAATTPKGFSCTEKACKSDDARNYCSCNQYMCADSVGMDIRNKSDYNKWMIMTHPDKDRDNKFPGVFNTCNNRIKYCRDAGAFCAK